ncbi:AbrB/MazE/SpoVT family DNA-binding domain-containing protein [Candidatus Methylobacter oryzae]|uniref:AbrB family transcriptional regulator n=1 Tax=Candidatus Methylobacter oryzae TaxID=2497749 RepID=A0ABY3C9B3_9GAMM|nr:AbrB family transcriptional regulator [Candidatus Methylobacter oryzae]TRW92909.1 AbrB family transcriptional regulator [Candidatus Methylobacter oryzae]
MQTSSQLIHRNQTTLPEPVLKALNLREGDAIIFEIDQTGVHLRKAPSIDIPYTEALQGTLSEWNSAADDEAYADL